MLWKSCEHLHYKDFFSILDTYFTFGSSCRITYHLFDADFFATTFMTENLSEKDMEPLAVRQH